MTFDPEIVNDIYEKPDQKLREELLYLHDHNMKGCDEIDAEYYWLIYGAIADRLPDYHFPCGRCGRTMHSAVRRHDRIASNVLCNPCLAMVKRETTKQAYMFGDQPPKSDDVDGVLRAVAALYEAVVCGKLKDDDNKITPEGFDIVIDVVNAYDRLLA